MDTLFQISSISEVIQLAVAPVFLLAGISGTLMVMSSRLGRIIDRGRYLKEKRPEAEGDYLQEIREELKCLNTRASYTNWAISMATFCALLVCLVIVFLFIGAVHDIDMTTVVAILFVLAMLCLSSAFILFLKEITLSTSAFKFSED